MRNNKIRLVIYLVLCAVILPMFCVFLSSDKTAVAETHLELQVESSDSKITKVSGNFYGYRILSSNDALNMLDDLKIYFGYSSSREALKFNKISESTVSTIYKFNQQINNIKVYGGEINVCVNSDGIVTSIIGCYYTDLIYDNAVNYSIEDGVNLLEEKNISKSINYIETVIDKTETSGCIAYIYEVSNDVSVEKVFLNANSGEIIKRMSSTTSLRDSLPTTGYTITQVETIQKNYLGQNVTLTVDQYSNGLETFYVLSDHERRIYVTDGGNKENSGNYSYKYYDSYMLDGKFSDSIAIQAYEYILKCYDFYADVNSFGEAKVGVRNTKDQVVDLIAIVHYGNNYENAACSVGAGNIGYFLFGDGNPNAIKNPTYSFVRGLDVVAHEYQHSVTDSEVALEYLNQSGALAEAFSDMFGAVIEGHDLDDPDFWRMGEDLYIKGNNYFRDNSNPATKNCTYSYLDLFDPCYSKTCNHATCDRGGVHYNSTLMPYATYIMYQQNPEFFTKTRILTLWWETLLRLTTTSNFVDFAAAMVSAAEDLGYEADEIRNIEFAFAAIDMPGYTGIEIWDGNTLQYLQGHGTITSPFLVENVEDLASVAYYVNNNESDGYYASARYKLTADITMPNVVWGSIGTTQYPFNGVFNGNYHTINGLNISANQGDAYAGLFGYAGEDSYIHDLYIGEGEVSTQAEYAGAIAGVLAGTISGCASSLKITGINVGGLAGLIINSYGGEKIVNSYTSADLEGEIVGGLVAVFATPRNASCETHISGYISSSYTLGNLEGQIVGGLVGKGNAYYLLNNITLVTLIGKNSSSVLGGFVGSSQFINPLTNNENITSKVQNYILSCKSTANFSYMDGAFVGSIIGNVNGNTIHGNVYIENCVIKERTSVEYCSNLEQTNIKIVETRTSTNPAFEGAFDFDSEKYYNAEENWNRLGGSESFDMQISFKVHKTMSMPIHKSAGFWLDHATYGFAGGNGSKSNPYQISTAGQLAYLGTLLFSENTYAQYYNKNYVLTKDIDLKGYIWTGLGYTIYTMENGVRTSAVLRAFCGNLDGNGNTIYNMTTLGAYSVQALNTAGTSYNIFELAPSLLGVTAPLEGTTKITPPTIKNLTLEDVNVSGSNAAAIASIGYYALNLENITVMGGTITSSNIAGGLIGRIEGLNYIDSGYTIEGTTSTIINCYTLVDLYGTVVGGVVGYVTNSSSTNASKLKVINYLNRGTIRASGINVEAYSNSGSYAYYKATAGSVIGVAVIKHIEIVNSINMGDVISYSEAPMLGAFIGSIGVGDNYSKSSINITIDGCKQIGEVYYVFDELLSSAGTILGGTYSSFAAIVNLTITDSTYTAKSGSVINNNQMGTAVSIDSKLNYSNDNVGEGAFDIYSDSYYSNIDYFNSDYLWSEDQTSRLYFTIIFRNYDGSVLSTLVLKDGESATPPAQNPTRPSTAEYDYEFSGWSEDVLEIHRSMSVYAEYTSARRNYKVNYYDLGGNLLTTKITEYGKEIDQTIEAPQKKSNFLFKYTFLRWGSEGQIVVGETNVKPVYQMSLTASAIAIIFAIAIVSLAGIIVIVSKKKI